MSTATILILAFPNVTQLDLTGPYEVFSRLPGAQVDMVWKTTDPIVSDTGFVLTPAHSFDSAPLADVIVVPGGPGQAVLMDDEETLSFLRSRAAAAQWVMSVCTGSLVLGAAGLIKGKRASCHWLSLPLISMLGGIPADERVVFDGTLCTTAGVSAGIDGALALVEKLAGRDTAEFIQLAIEYDPRPLFNAGSPRTAPPELVARVTEMAAPMIASRTEGVRAIAAKLGLTSEGPHQ
ncbi:MAG: DJ-1/PfpI family protein [Pararhodobacter sp.]|nr:DJ-1/PfpI family protein [Pararhodobacter sp.]